MKSVTLLVGLAVLAAAFIDASVINPAGPLTRTNLAVGVIANGDRLLARQYLRKTAIANAIQSEDLIYRGNQTTRVTAVRATEQGYTQYASAWIVSGGIGFNNVTVRAQSYRGYGYYYLVDVYGR